MEPRRFFIDTQNRRFVSGIENNLQIFPPTFYSEDVEKIELYFLEPENVGSNKLVVKDYSTAAVKFAVGATTPAALGVTWTALPGTITASITTITNGSAGTNEVQRLTFVGRKPLSGGLRLTIPARTVNVSSLTNGDYSATDHGFLRGQIITLAGFTASGNFNYNGVTYSSVVVNRDVYISATSDSSFKVKYVFGYPNALPDSDDFRRNATGGGTASIKAITTRLIPWNNLNAAAIQSAFSSAAYGSSEGFVVNGEPQIVVSGNYEDGFTIEFANSLGGTNFGNLGLQSTLSSEACLEGSVNFNTSNISSLIGLDGVKMEVEILEGSTRHTTQTDCYVKGDVIDSTSSTPLPANTASSFNLSDNNGGVWTVTIDSNGSLTAAKV